MDIRAAIVLAATALATSAVVATADDFAGEISLLATIPRGGDFMGFGFDSLWMMGGSKLVRVNPSDNSFAEIPIEGAVGKYRGIAIGEGAVWVPDVGSQIIFKVDPQKNQVVSKISADISDSEGSIGVGAGSVWAVTGVGSKLKLTRYDAKSGTEQTNITLPPFSGSSGVIFDFGYVWITDSINHALYRVNPNANQIAATIPLHSSPRFLTSGDGSVWVLNQGDGTVQRIDGKSGEILATIDAKATGGGGDIAFGGGSVWVTTMSVPVIRIDPVTNSLRGKFKRPSGLFGVGDAIRYGAGSLWVSGSSIFRIRPPQ
jgi:streptogramin lyase